MQIEAWMGLAPLCGGTHTHINSNFLTFKNSEGVQHCFCIIETGYELDSLRYWPPFKKILKNKSKFMSLANFITLKTKNRDPED